MSLRVPLPDPKNPQPWAHHMHLAQIGPSTFRSTMGALSGAWAKLNGEMRPRAFGGHVYAQAAYAASKTVEKEFVVHV